jgi:hypothetical protein
LVTYSPSETATENPELDAGNTTGDNKGGRDTGESGSLIGENLKVVWAEFLTSGCFASFASHYIWLEKTL